MITIKRMLFLVLVSFLPCLVFAQIEFSVYGNYGLSNFIEKNSETIVVGNYYNKLPSYSLGGEMLYSFSNSNLGLISGLNYSSFGAENHMPDDFVDPNYTGSRSWEERFYSLSLPLKANYTIEEWVRLNAGLVNTIHLSKPTDLTTKKMNTYTLSFAGGVDFIIKRRFIIGAMYYRDILPTMLLLKAPPKPETYDIKYSIEQYSIKIGYIFNR